MGGRPGAAGANRTGRVERSNSSTASRTNCPVGRGPASADVSVQAVVLNPPRDLKASLGMSCRFVSHDLEVVRLLCDHVIVMRNGRIVEEGATSRVLNAPRAEYTRELLSAIPHPPV